MDRSERGILVPLPLTWDEFAVLGGLASLALASFVVWLLLPKVGPDNGNRIARFRDPLGLQAMHPALFVAAFLLWGVLLLSLVFGLLLTIGEATANALGFLRGDEAAARLPLLTVAGLTATLGAIIALPFTLIRRLHSERQTKATEEGLITDRINAAVASLGAERVVKETVEKPRFRKDAAGNLERDAEGRPVAETDADGQSIIDRETREVTRPNLEVRIGAILALERIAHEKLAFHVQIMQILCAYVRTNAPASQADGMTEFMIYPDEDLGPARADWQMRWKDYRERLDANLKMVVPREDTVIAIDVLGRRTAQQRAVEARWGHPKASATFIFDEPCPELPDSENVSAAPADQMIYREQLEEWGHRILGYPGYRLNLSNTDLCNHDLSHCNLAGARLDGSRLQGAHLWKAQLRGAFFHRAHLQRASLGRAQAQGAYFADAQLQGAFLVETKFQGANFTAGLLQNAHLESAQLQGSNLAKAGLQCADLTEASLQATNLSEARLQDAWLEHATIDKMTSFNLAAIQGTLLRGVDLSWSGFSTNQLASAFGDGSVIRPDHARPGDVSWPAHWAKTELDFHAFHVAWRAWRPTLDTLPPS